KELTLIEDNASIHTLKATIAAKQALGILKISWPANLPNLNPIKNVWQILKYRLEK
ncbi:transposable element Tcb2 transposase, partial [Lindgomyces ingoldianus]